MNIPQLKSILKLTLLNKVKLIKIIYIWDSYIRFFFLLNIYGDVFKSYGGTCKNIYKGDG